MRQKSDKLPSERLLNDDIASFWSEGHGDGGSEDVDSLEQGRSSFNTKLEFLVAGIAATRHNWTDGRGC